MWEYKESFCYLKDQNTNTHLNEYGDNGWELVQVIYRPDIAAYVFFFKCKKK
jgi:hypothetical protein